MTAEPSFTVLPTDRRHWRAVRLLLPAAVHFGCECRLFVACEGQTDRVIAAAAMSPWARRLPVPGYRIAVHVIEPWRRRGIAGALLGRLDAVAAGLGARALYSWDALEPHNPAAILWRALGFDQSQDHPLTRVDAGRTVQYLQLLSDRLEKHRSFPADLRVIRLAEANPPEAAKLHARYLGGTVEMALGRLTGQVPGSFDLNLSRALLHENRVVGLALVRPMSPTVLWIEGNLLHPQFRGGWGNLRLKLDCARACLNAGMKTFVYETFSEHVDSQKFADRVGGITVERLEMYRMIPQVAG